MTTRIGHADRGLFRLALLVAIAVHALAFAVLRFPATTSRTPGGSLVVVPRAIELDAGPRRPESTLAEPAPPGGARAKAEVARLDRAPVLPATPIPVIRPSPAAREEATIPSTALVELRAATLPLVPTEIGIGRRRIERTPEEIAHARAESLLFARMAGIAVAERRDVGAVGLANGGITLAIPWAGFLPADRFDGEWRRQRCSEGGDGGDDKAGEGEARRASC